MVTLLVDMLAALKPDIIIHSGMVRTGTVAEALARRLGKKCTAEPLWRERDFGAWEGQSWNTIYRSTGNDMDGMIDDPAGFRPGDDGETTAEMVRRVLAAMCSLPADATVIVISHGGPIAAARMLADKAGFGDLAQLIIRPGASVQIEASALKSAISSPCIHLCQLDASREMCLGCLRTTDEIGVWTRLNGQAQARLMQTLKKRRVQMP